MKFAVIPWITLCVFVHSYIAVGQIYPPRDCYYGIGTTYNGPSSHTLQGRRCALWSDNRGIYPITEDTLTYRGFDMDPITDARFPERSVYAAGNFCRNPDNDPDGPWCFLGQGEAFNTGVCGVPRC